jgi:site-specific DNA-cytosine methylase
MTIGSLFSGIGGFELGLAQVGETIWCSEIDKYASAIHKYHYPECVNYGDTRRIIPDDTKVVSVFV